MNRLKFLLFRGHIPIRFFDDVVKVFESGVRGDRKPLDWMKYTPEEANDRVRSAMRHLANAEYDAAAANCVILWWHFQRNRTERPETK